ncbi:MAG: hypothetical protein P9M15_07050, partial [Candidatus Electryoneaceae bacterium]|nr:hypothetical protein [Candidatus Electryoneaceae bacterium]
MKILYVAPEHISGGFSLFAKGHQHRGNDCRWVTFFRNQFGFPEDLCFDLLAMPVQGWVGWLRRLVNRTRGELDIVDLEGNPPIWRPASAMEDAWFKLRDFVNTPRIRHSIDRWKLSDYDIYHFEQGIDPFRDGRWIQELKSAGKGIVCFYHGTDLRNRGAIEAVHRVSDLNLTSEIDLLDRLPGMKYLYLPIDTDKLRPKPRRSDGRIRICHAARNRTMKGSDQIEAVVCKLAGQYPIDWVMIENMSHYQALEIKAECDIYIDQITDRGGWGYGASSVESLSLGLPTVTRINPQVADFLGDHPFVSANPDTLEKSLIPLIENEDHRLELAVKGR